MRAVFDKHLDEESLELYCLGKLSAQQIDEVEDHLLICPQCRSRLEETEEFLITFRKAVQELDAEATQPSWLQRLLEKLGGYVTAPLPVRVGAVAAAAALLAVILIPRSEQPATPVMVTLEAVRSASIGQPTVPAAVPLQLRLDTKGLPAEASYLVQIVDHEGSLVWQGTVSMVDAYLQVEFADGLPAGTYWVRLYRHRLPEQLLREYRLQVFTR